MLLVPEDTGWHPHCVRHVYCIGYRICKDTRKWSSQTKKERRCADKPNEATISIALKQLIASQDIVNRF